MRNLFPSKGLSCLTQKEKKRKERRGGEKKKRKKKKAHYLEVTNNTFGYSALTNSTGDSFEKLPNLSGSQSKKYFFSWFRLQTRSVSRLL